MVIGIVSVYREPVIDIEGLEFRIKFMPLTLNF